MDSLITRLLEGERDTAGSQRAPPPLPAGTAGAAGAVRGKRGQRLPCAAGPGVAAGSGLGASRRCPEPRPCSPAEGGGAGVRGGCPPCLAAFLFNREKENKKSLVFHFPLFTPLQLPGSGASWGRLASSALERPFPPRPSARVVVAVLRV